MLKKTMEERGDQKKIQVIIRCNQTGLSRPPGGYTLCTCGLGAYTLVKKKKKKSMPKYWPTPGKGSGQPKTKIAPQKPKSEVKGR